MAFYGLLAHAATIPINRQQVSIHTNRVFILVLTSFWQNDIEIHQPASNNGTTIAILQPHNAVQVHEMEHLNKRAKAKPPAKPKKSPAIAKPKKGGKKVVAGGGEKSGGGNKRGGGGAPKSCSQGTIFRKGGSFGSCPASTRCGTCVWTGKKCAKAPGWSDTADCRTICGCLPDR